jgi:3-hydroxy acid dehydrogenase / malonic semialdehyde reductase
MKKFLIISVLTIFIIGAWYFIMPLFDRIPPINESTKTCLVTGASSGIGAAISSEMVKRGWKVIGIARRKDKLEELTKKLGQEFIPFVCDVSQSSQIHLTSEEIKKQNLKPSLFFLNAGTGLIEPSNKLSQQIHVDTFNTNYFGVIGWVEEWINDIKNFGGGTFVATSSVASLFATPSSASYSASKAAINKCFQSLRLQYLNDNIGFSIVLPGPVATDMLKGGEKLPFIHTPEQEATYIVKQVFKRNKQIEPSWFYSCLLRILNWLPDRLVLKVLK